MPGIRETDPPGAPTASSPPSMSREAPYAAPSGRSAGCSRLLNSYPAVSARKTNTAPRPSSAPGAPTRMSLPFVATAAPNRASTVTSSHPSRSLSDHPSSPRRYTYTAPVPSPGAPTASTSPLTSNASPKPVRASTGGGQRCRLGPPVASARKDVYRSRPVARHGKDREPPGPADEDLVALHRNARRKR